MEIRQYNGYKNRKCSNVIYYLPHVTLKERVFALPTNRGFSTRPGALGNVLYETIGLCLLKPLIFLAES